MQSRDVVQQMHVAGTREMLLWPLPKQIPGQGMIVGCRMNVSFVEHSTNIDRSINVSFAKRTRVLLA